MPFMRTDDGPRKLRAVWLGPKGATLPFEWTYVQWGVTLGAVPVGGLLLVVVLAVLGVQPWVLVPAAVAGAYLGLLSSVKVMRNVTFDEPLRHKRATVRSEFSRQRRRPEKTRAMSWEHPKVRDLSPGTASLLTPVKDFR